MIAHGCSTSSKREPPVRGHLVRLVLESDWFTPAPGEFDQIGGGGADLMFLYERGPTRSDVLACRRREGIPTPVWVIDGEVGRDELQTGKQDDRDGQHDLVYVCLKRSDTIANL